MLEEAIQKQPKIWYLYHTLAMKMVSSSVYSDEEIEKVYLKAIELNPQNYASHHNISCLRSKTSL